MKLNRSQLRRIIEETISEGPLQTLGFPEPKPSMKDYMVQSSTCNPKHDVLVASLRRELDKMTLPVELIRNCDDDGKGVHIYGMLLHDVIEQAQKLAGKKVTDESIVGVIRFTDSYNSKSESGYKSLRKILVDTIIPKLNIPKIYVGTVGDYRTVGAGHGGVGPGYGLLIVNPV